MAALAASGSSPQPIETAAMAGTSRTIVRAAITSSSAIRPCVTTTMPIIAHPSFSCRGGRRAPGGLVLRTAAATAFASITERCRPPVQPTAMVR